MINQATTEQHAVMNSQLVLARKILSEECNATIDSRDVVIKGGKLICEIYQLNMPKDSITHLNNVLRSRIDTHPDSKIRDNSVRVFFI